LDQRFGFFPSAPQRVHAGTQVVVHGTQRRTSWRTSAVVESGNAGCSPAARARRGAAQVSQRPGQGLAAEPREDGSEQEGY